jgi:CubicO group peptidase (beta-lactamase class C family)
MDTNLAQASANTPDFRSLDETIMAFMERLHVPGVAVGVLYGDQQHAAGFGVTNIKHPLPSTQTPSFRSARSLRRLQAQL